LRDGLLASLPLLVASALLVWRLRQRLLEGIRWLVLVGLFELVLGPVGYAWLDVALDRAPPEIHRVSVIDKREASESIPDGGTRHRLEVVIACGRRQGDQKILDVRERIYRAAEPGGTLTLRIRPGRFGHAWIEPPAQEDLSPRVRRP